MKIEGLDGTIVEEDMTSQERVQEPECGEMRVSLWTVSVIITRSVTDCTRASTKH